MTWTLICAGGLALVAIGCLLVELASLGRVPLEERAGKALAAIGTVVCILAVLAAPH